MEVRIIGGNLAMLPLLEAIRTEPDWHVVGWYDSSDIDDSLRKWFPRGRAFGSISQLSLADVDGLIIASNGCDLDSLEPVLRDLARESVPLVLVQPGCSAIFGFELDMIQRDTGSPILPFHAASFHPALAQIADWISDSSQSPIGHIEQIVFERGASNRDDSIVLASLARDGLVLRRVAGDFLQVGAMQGGSAGRLANLNAQIAPAHSDAMIRWVMGPATDGDQAALELIGADGKASLSMPVDGTWKWDTRDANRSGDLADFSDYDQPAAIRDYLRRGLDGAYVFPQWEDGCRALDLAEIASESVRRQKTLPVSNERPTEEDTFKGMMAAGGCLIIMVLPFILLLVALVDGLQIPFGKRLVHRIADEQRIVDLPSDLKVVQSVELTDTKTRLRQLPPEVLRTRYANQPAGTPQAFSVSRGSLILGPAADHELELYITYKGSFTVWAGWPLLLLLPILLFLALQLSSSFSPRTRGKRHPSLPNFRDGTIEFPHNRSGRYFVALPCNPARANRESSWVGCAGHSRGFQGCDSSKPIYFANRMKP